MSDYKYNKIEVTGNTEGFDIDIDCAEGSVEISPATQCEATVRNIDVEGTRQYGTSIVSVQRGFIIAPITQDARLYIEDIERTMYMDQSGSGSGFAYVYTPNQEIRISVQGKLGANTATVSNLQAVADNSSKGLLISTTGSTVVIKPSTATFAESELRNRAITITATVAGQSVSETVYVKTVVHAQVEVIGEGKIQVSDAKTCISYVDSYNVLHSWNTEDPFEFDIKCTDGVKPTITNAYIRANGGTEYSDRITLNNIFTLEVDVTDVKLKLSKNTGFVEKISGALQYELKLIGTIGPSSVPVEYYYTNGSFPLVNVFITGTVAQNIVIDENNNIEPNTFTVTPIYTPGSQSYNVYITDIKPLDGNQITDGVSVAIQADKTSIIVTTTNVKRTSNDPIKYILTVQDTDPSSANSPTIYVQTICTLNVKHATVGIASFTNGFDTGSVANRNIISCVLGSSGTIEYIEVDNTNHSFNPVSYGTIYEMTPSLKTNDNVSSIGVGSIKPLGIYTDVAKQHSANVDGLQFTIETNTISKKVLIRFNYYTSTFTNSNVNDTYYLFYKVTGTKNELYYVAETYICIKIVDHISIKVSENTLNPLLNQYGRYDELQRFAPIWIKVFDNTGTVIPNDNIQGVTLIDRGNALQGLRYEYRNDYTMWFDVNGDTNTVAHESTPYTLDMRINFSVNGNTYYNAELYIVDSGIKDYETIIVPINCAYDVMFNAMDLVDSDCGDYANSSYMIPVYQNSNGVNILATTAQYTDTRGKIASFPPDNSSGGIQVPDTYLPPYYGVTYPRTNIRMAAPKEFIADFDEYTRTTHEITDRGYPIEEAIWNGDVNNFLEDEQDNIKVIQKAKDGTVIDSAVQLTIVALSDSTDEGRTLQVYVPSRYTNDPPIQITKYEPKNCEIFAIKLKLDNTKSLVNPQTEAKITIELFDDSKRYGGKNLLIITNYVKVGFEYYNPAVDPFNGAWNINAETQPTVRTLTCSANNSTYGTVKGAGSYQDGSKVYIEAIPSSIRYVFEKWSDNSTQNPYLVTLNADKTYVANFISNPKYVNVDVDDSANRGDLSFNNGSNDAYISQTGIINLKLYYDVEHFGNGEYATCSIDKIEVIKTGKTSYEIDNYITKFFVVSGQFLLGNESNVSEPPILRVPAAAEQELHTYITGKITAIKIYVSLVYTRSDGYIFNGTYQFQFQI